MASAEFACLVPPDRRIICPQSWVGKTVLVSVGRRKASAPQFRWYRGIALPILADALGYDKDERDYLHDAVLVACYGAKRDPLGREVPARRTRTHDTKDMADFQEWFIRWCAREHGVMIPDPQR